MMEVNLLTEKKKERKKKLIEFSIRHSKICILKNKNALFLNICLLFNKYHVKCRVRIIFQKVECAYKN